MTITRTEANSATTTAELYVLLRLYGKTRDREIAVGGDASADRQLAAALFDNSLLGDLLHRKLSRSLPATVQVATGDYYAAARAVVDSPYYDFGDYELGTQDVFQGGTPSYWNPQLKKWVTPPTGAVVHAYRFQRKITGEDHTTVYAKRPDGGPESVFADVILVLQHPPVAP